MNIRAFRDKYKIYRKIKKRQKKKKKKKSDRVKRMNKNILQIKPAEENICDVWFVPANLIRFIFSLTEFIRIKPFYFAYIGFSTFLQDIILLFLAYFSFHFMGRKILLLLISMVFDFINLLIITRAKNNKKNMFVFIILHVISLILKISYAFILSLFHSKSIIPISNYPDVYKENHLTASVCFFWNFFCTFFIFAIAALLNIPIVSGIKMYLMIPLGGMAWYTYLIYYIYGILSSAHSFLFAIGFAYIYFAAFYSQSKKVVKKITIMFLMFGNCIVVQVIIYSFAIIFGVNFKQSTEIGFFRMLWDLAVVCYNLVNWIRWIIAQNTRIFIGSMEYILELLP